MAGAVVVAEIVPTEKEQDFAIAFRTNGGDSVAAVAAAFDQQVSRREAVKFLASAGVKAALRQVAELQRVEDRAFVAQRYRTIMRDAGVAPADCVRAGVALTALLAREEDEERKGAPLPSPVFPSGMDGPSDKAKWLAGLIAEASKELERPLTHGALATIDGTAS